MNKIDRLQIVIREGKCNIDYAIVTDKGEYVADGTIENFLPSQMQSVITDCENFIKQSFGIE